MNNQQSLFSIVTPSFNQLDWLRLCVASVRDQVAPACGGIVHSSLPIAHSGQASELANQQISFEKSSISSQKSSIPPLAVEHILQDAGFNTRPAGAFSNRMKDPGNL